MQKRTTETDWDHGHRDLQFILCPIRLSAEPSHMSTECKMPSHSGITRNGSGHPRFKIKLQLHMSSPRTQQLHVTTLPITGLGQDPTDRCWLGVMRVRTVINQTARVLHSGTLTARTIPTARQQHDDRRRGGGAQAVTSWTGEDHLLQCQYYCEEVKQWPNGPTTLNFICRVH